MENKFYNIGYIGWTEDAATLAEAVAEKHKDKRDQYVLCPAGTELPAYVKAVSGPEEMAELCKVVAITEGSDLSALEGLQAYISRASPARTLPWHCPQKNTAVPRGGKPRAVSMWMWQRKNLCRTW